MSKSLDISIIIPVYNEWENLPLLFQRLTATLDKEPISYEVIFTNDGSQDTSLDVLKEFYQTRPNIVRIIDFHGNFGQHMAIMAAFEKSQGVTG